MTARNTVNLALSRRQLAGQFTQGYCTPAASAPNGVVSTADDKPIFIAT